MTYTLNEYYRYASSTATRAEVYSDNNTAANLLAYHKQNGAVELALSECIGTDLPNLPMPDALIQELDMKITSNSKRVVVTGIDAYLSLLSKQNVKAFMVALHGRIEVQKLNAVYLISGNRFDGTNFTNPKYENSLQVVRIGDSGQYLTQVMVSVVSQKWVHRGSHPTNWNALLKTLGQFEPTGNYILVLDNYDIKQAGLSDSVMQLLDIFKIAECFYGITANIPKKVLETLVSKCKDMNISPLDFLKSQFGQDNANIRLAVKRLLELRDDELWLAYVWFLKKTIDGSSYFVRVLSENLSHDNLLRKYVCDTAITVLTDANATKFANERSSAIIELGNTADSLIIEFISKIKNYSNETVACWLNSGTEAERIEIVRRVSESDLTVGFPQMWRNLYPLFADYLSDEYNYGNDDLTAYFRDYRRMKISNTVTADFVKKAFDFVLPTTFVLRDAVLQELSVDNDTALLVVDGMGAEYFPLILAMAKRMAMNIESATIAAVKLPTSTEFNAITWEKSRWLEPSVHEVDNIAHYGAAKHENCPPPRNIVATLAVFEEVINRISNGFTSYERIVVTADHGTSRLAVLAHENNMNTTLSWNGEPEDWRYAIAPPNTQRPPEFEPYYDAEKNITYWVVRGYNRLPKKGPKLYELHGGASLEERLVPIVVFSRDKSDNIPKQLGKKAVEQLVEKMDFDI